MANDRPVMVSETEIPGRIFLAPVAGYSDAAFRSVCAELGAAFAYTEMVSSEALIRANAKTWPLMDRAPNERLYAIQLFGSKPEVLEAAVAIAAERRPALIDLNCGCPVPKIVKSGAGSALMRDLSLMGRIVAAMVKASPVPVTIKLRLGWDSASINYLEAARIAVAEGAAAVCLHARTRAQGYSGQADWGMIRNLRVALEVPVFGSGDVWSPADAIRMLDETGCDAVMVARGCFGDPFFFREARCLMEGTEPEPPKADERVQAMRKHLALSAGFIGERMACVEFRKHFCSYTKGLERGARLRAEAVKASTMTEFEALFAALLE